MGPDGGNTGAIAVDKVVAAASDFYAAWEDAREIPATVKMDGKDYTIAQFIQAEAAALVAVSKNQKDDIAIKDYRAAANPDKDSYDQNEIAVTNGPKDGKDVPEDLVTIAGSILSKAAENNQIPNQSIVYRGTTALAFSTNRATVTIARALAAYATAGSLPAKVETDYLSASTSLKAFAEQFVTYLDVWENTVADILSADGSACEDNNNAWERVHFIPIPQDTKNDWVKQGAQWDPKYPHHTIEIEGTTYTAAQCWEIAIRGLMNLCTIEGEEFLNTMARNTPIPFGNGMSLTTAPISRPSAACVWGKYPWYESKNDGGPVKYNGQPIEQVGIEFILKCGAWHVTRSFIENDNNSPLGMIGNYQQFGTGSGTLNLDGYEGLICPMREFLIMARIYKYILDHNITKDVYDAIKDVKVDFELYNQELPVIAKTEKLTFEATPEGGQQVEFTATGNWTAASEYEWIHVSPASGAAGDATVTVTVDNYEVEEIRTGDVVITSGDFSKSVSITQNAWVKPVTGTLEDFAKAFVTLLPVWEATVGTVDADGTHNGKTAWKNVHFLPIYNPAPGYTNAGNQYDEMWKPYWSAKVGEDEYTSNQCWEIAIRGLMNLCTVEGEAHLQNMVSRNNNMYTLGNGTSLDSPMPTYSSNNKWGANPWYETNGTVKYNGEDIAEVDIAFMLKCCSWHVVRSFIKNSGNDPLGNVGNFQEFGTSVGSSLVYDGYIGQIAPMRELIILARIYKYILDNNIKTNVYDAIKDVKFDYDMYHQVPSLQAFATEFVKCLDVWQANVGTIEADGQHNGANAFKNVHYIPTPTTGYPDSDNNKGEAFTITLGKETITLPQCYIIAAKGFLHLCTVEKGTLDHTQFKENELNTYTLGNGGSMNDPIGEYKYSWAHFSKMPWYESDDGLGAFNATTAGIDLLKETTPWHLYRSSANGAVTNWQRLGNPGGSYHPLGPKYTGYISAMREILILARLYKYILDNNVTENVYDAVKDLEIDATLY